MKKVLLLIFVGCMALAAYAQEVPYAKYLTFGRKEFKESRFKYDEENNAWVLRKINGLNTTLNILAIIAEADEEVRPSEKDYSIMVQMGAEEKASYVKVRFYSDETYHKLLTFMKDFGSDYVETSSGRLIKQQAAYGDYALELNMDQHIISRTSARTADVKTVKNVDESYNEYHFFIYTGVEPWSEYLEIQAAKKAKRDAKGKKKQSVDELM